MRRRTWFFPLAIAAWAMFAIEARAGDWDACKNDNPDVSIFGCTAIIDAGTDQTKNIADAHYLRGNAYYRKTEFGRAIADYSEVIALHPDYANAYVLRGAAYEQQGKKQKAVADYSKALALRPGNKTATQGLQRLVGPSAEAKPSTSKG